MAILALYSKAKNMIGIFQKKKFAKFNEDKSTL